MKLQLGYLLVQGTTNLTFRLPTKLPAWAFEYDVVVPRVIAACFLERSVRLEPERHHAMQSSTPRARHALMVAALPTSLNTRPKTQNQLISMIFPPSGVQVVTARPSALGPTPLKLPSPNAQALTTFSRESPSCQTRALVSRNLWSTAY